MDTGNGDREASQKPREASGSSAHQTPPERPVEGAPSAPESSPPEKAEGAAFPAAEARPGVETVIPEGQAGSPGGRPGGWFGRHKVLTGVLAGLVTIVLLGAMFAIGYAVGKPDGKEPAPAAPVYDQPWREYKPFQSRPRLRGKMENLLERMGILREARDELLELAASELGMSPGELKDRLEDGETIADLAEEKGLSTEELVNTLASRIEEIADRLASEGTLTASQAEAVKSRAEAMASLFVHGGLRVMLGPAWR